MRVKKLSGVIGVYEMSWAPDGRATFSMGQPIVDGKLHIVGCGSAAMKFFRKLQLHLFSSR